MRNPVATAAGSSWPMSTFLFSSSILSVVSAALIELRMSSIAGVSASVRITGTMLSDASRCLSSSRTTKSGS